MRAEQKRAWFTVAVAVIALVGFVVLIPKIGLIPATAAFSIFGLAGLTPLLFRDRAAPGEVVVDERDQMIAQKAALGGAMISYQYFIAACLIVWFICMRQARMEISINVLPTLCFGGMVVAFAARSVIVLVLYGREEVRGEA